MKVLNLICNLHITICCIIFVEPSPPTNVIVSTNNNNSMTSFFVSFTKPQAKQDEYKVVVDSLTSNCKVITKTKESCTLVKNLTPSNTYCIKVYSLCGTDESEVIQANGVFSTGKN